jgi:dUTP pyrophosphatase
MHVKIINKSSNPLPRYETIGSAGFDLRANLETAITLQPFERRLIPTGLFMEIPLGFEGQIRPRSGVAFKRGLTCANTPGTIDSDYRGEVQLPMINLSTAPQLIEPGERLAQMIVAKHERVEWVVSDSLDDTDRGAGGFGSTGK